MTKKRGEPQADPLIILMSKNDLHPFFVFDLSNHDISKTAIMRLQQHEIDSITSIAKAVFGEGSKVILFGSRVNDEQRGGDIDLFIQPGQQDALIEKKIDFLVALKDQIGDQKIDVVLAKDSTRLIEQEALKKGIVLA